MEMWKDIPGYEGRYQASSLGRIRSVPRPVRCANNGIRTVPGRVLRPGRYDKSGHVSVVLGHGENGTPVHQLVAKTFLGPRPDGAEILHGDGNPLNNSLENLRYGTRLENIYDMYRHGTGRSKLSVEEVLKIKGRLSNGEKGSVIARDYGVSQTVVSNIKKERTFQWINEC